MRSKRKKIVRKFPKKISHSQNLPPFSFSPRPTQNPLPLFSKTLILPLKTGGKRERKRSEKNTKEKTMSSFTNTTNFDNLLLQTLMGRLQIRPPNNSYNPFLTQSLEDLLLDAANLSDSDSDDSDKTQLAKEESKLEKEIIRIILSGKIDSLKPNSGQAVTINEHHICITFHEEKGSDYRVWEWHGHIMLFDDENGYTPEYIYGNYFERLQGKPRVARDEEEKEDEAAAQEEEEEEEKVGNLGLRELIDGGADSGGGRILHRNINAGSPRFL